MKTIVISEQATIPVWVHDLASFRRWAHSDDFPEQGRFAYLDGQLWVDLTIERLAQNQIKAECGRVLCNLVKDEGMGLYVVDGLLLTNVAAELSTEPDGMFVTDDCLEKGSATIEEGDRGLELTGSPDMTLEVISPTSVKKDTVDLLRLYWEAGVKEYWLIDSREKTFSFEILRRGPSGFIATRRRQGWLKSPVFGREFKLTKEAGKHGVSKFTLEMR